MFYLSITLSVILFLGAVAAAAWEKEHMQGAVTWCAVGVFSSLATMCLMFVLPIFILHSVLQFCVALGCRVINSGMRTFAMGSTAAFIIAYGVGIYMVNDRIEELRDRHPVVSVNDRLAYTASATVDRGKPVTNTSLDLFESHVAEKESTQGWIRGREEQLRKLHEDYVGMFVRASGFGVGRMPDLDYQLNPYTFRPKTPPLPDPQLDWQSPESPKDLQGTKGIADEISPLVDTHRKNVIDFVFPRGFGYRRDRDYVVGFESHRFSDPLMRDYKHESHQWELVNLQLMSLLKSDEPRVYLSDHFPRMTELREAPTRALTDFEREGLEQLRAGRDLFYQHTDQLMHLLGAIRAARQCLDCHDGQRGELLGAFSYRLVR